MDVLLQILWGILRFFLGHVLIFNMIFAVIIVFFQRRDPKSVWAWLLLLVFIPYLGFILYLFLGADMHKRKMFRIKEVEDQLSEVIRRQEHTLKSTRPDGQDPDIGDYTDLIMYNLETSGAVLTDENDITVYTDGNDKFEALLEDIRSAEEFIHIQYYIIRDDIVFARLREALLEKARQGVEVRILYDAMGCSTVRHSFWRDLNRQGIQTAEFFPARLRRLHLRINYRNHRKIVVIDNRVGYVGGFNVGREYIGLDEKFGHWRDTHLRLQGGAVLGLQLRFLLDWNYAAGENLFQNSKFFSRVYPGSRDHCRVQIISSGPDTREEYVCSNYLRLVHKAKKSIYIQTPYFIPDEALLRSLIIAVHSGVEVNVMIPCKPDHPFVHSGSLSYLGELVMAGANCYTYDNGFLHSKGMTVDGRVFCYGTANLDIRSFSLNFEVNAVVYNRAKAQEMVRIFQEDLKSCTQITRDMYAGRKLGIRVREQICRLLSPLL